MFEKIKKAFKNATSESSSFDASRFGDELALTTEWTPCKRGGTNFKTHKLVEVRYDRMEFKTSTGMLLFSGIFTLVGVIMFIIPLFIDAQGGELFFLPLMGLIFGGVGGWLYYSSTTPTIFDKTVGMYWKTRKTPDFYRQDADSDKKVRLSDIHAIQLLSEYVKSDKGGYYSYELNLVLKSGKRLNVVDHGKRSVILEDAEKLSRFLNVPVWDGTS